ncbi:unnamed protein product [Nippostrongylus brasiliensis]|uniref:Uncharacterized protein n=1 Tax=Nippostrongylus brasiliensis TaxID=27835 RepID=A0A0N4YQS1_NIPBR|nr:unnamed protein product [Nippostrongylus brasiliensis]
MRGRLPTIPGCADVQARIKRSAAINDRSSLQSVDSGVSSLEQVILTHLLSFRTRSKFVLVKVVGFCYVVTWSHIAVRDRIARQRLGINTSFCMSDFTRFD